MRGGHLIGQTSCLVDTSQLSLVCATRGLVKIRSDGARVAADNVGARHIKTRSSLNVNSYQPLPCCDCARTAPRRCSGSAGARSPPVSSYAAPSGGERIGARGGVRNGASEYAARLSPLGSRDYARGFSRADALLSLKESLSLTKVARNAESETA